jgi:ribonucleotide reductase alpha subunit
MSDNEETPKSSNLWGPETWKILHDIAMKQFDSSSRPDNLLSSYMELPHRNPISLTDNARTVMTKRYLRKGKNGELIEDEHEMFWRISIFVALAEFELEKSGSGEKSIITKVYQIANDFYDMLTSLKFLPNTPTFMGAGTPLGQLAACFVLPIEDDMGKLSGGIFQTLRDSALIQQTGGGNGFAFSRLRPAKSLVNSSMGQASGPVGFLRVYDHAFGEVAQGGTRRGANMAVLRCDHPDIRQFINCKTDERSITNFNISVGITDAFMKAVENDEDFDLVAPHNGEVYETVKARELFNEIAEKAHHNGEPGVLFLDTANKTNPVPHLYELESTNPCITADAVIATTDGLKYVKDLIGKKFKISYCYDHKNIVNVDSTSEGFFSTGIKDVFKLTLDNGKTLRLTDNHQVLTYELGDDEEIVSELFVAAKDLTSDHLIAIDNPLDFLMTGKMVSLEPDGQEEVYDCIIPSTHRFSANGIMVHNCGEQWLGPYESCCLGSINLAQHKGVQDSVDWNSLEETTKLATRYLDDVITANQYVPAVPQLKEAADRCRRIGLGIMGLADLMFHCGIAYGSKEGQAFGAVIMEFIRYHSMLESIRLAQTRGPFPGIKGSVYDPESEVFGQGFPERLQQLLNNTNGCSGDGYMYGCPDLDWNVVIDGIKENGIRNAAQTTIAPTGTISTVASCEGYGCEPVFALAYYRNVVDDGSTIQLRYTSPELESALNKANLNKDDMESILDCIAECGSIQKLPAKIRSKVPENIAKVFLTSEDISWEDHIRQQAALQKYVDNSISKTINMPNEATVEDVKQAYKLAYDLGCKGLTVYRTGSRDIVVLETKSTKEAKLVDTASQQGSESRIRKPRPSRVKGETHRIETPMGDLYVTINEEPGSPGDPLEVFLQSSKAGSDIAAVTEALGRLISQNLRMSSNVPQKDRLLEMARQLRGIGGQRSLGLGPMKVRSLPDGISKAFLNYLTIHGDARSKLLSSGMVLSVSGGSNSLDDNTVIEDTVAMYHHTIGDLCPDCGEATYIYTEGCRKCTSCGMSEC